MKIRRKLREACPNGIDCPAVYELDDDRVIVRGDAIKDAEVLRQLGLPEHETAVIVPRSLFREV
jgi:hypothetical protein